MSSTDPRWLNKAKSPVDSIFPRQIQINSQKGGHCQGRLLIDKQCGKTPQVSEGWGLDVSINSSQSLFLAWSYQKGRETVHET